ncbi:Crp/Fnr family transcriptional regulator [Terriglobus sp.]|uniref:Crp/Fnr family transcriptional regulator n=1 Tax=Terriglobus sp. TaxID=1889013 RepID=UPI003B00952A
MLLSQLETVQLPLRTVLFDAHVQPRHVHFLLSGIASILTSMANSEAVEICIVGHEGFPEKIHLLGPQLGETRCFMQLVGSALRMDLRRFKTLFLESPELQDAVHRYIQHDSLVLAQIGACNRLHAVEARLARWLLMVQDRTQTPELKLTQEFLGEMLGARRSSVNLAASALQRAGLISYSRGRIRIEDRDGLQKASCECYAIIHKLFQQLYA